MSVSLESVRDHLVSQGIVRRQRETTPAGAPPLWLQPDEGVPAPGEGSNPVEVGADVVVGAFLIDQRPPAPGQPDGDIVEFRIRVMDVPLAEAFRDQLLDEYAPEPYKRRWAWVMGTQYVLESHQQRGFAPLGSDQQSSDFSISFLFETTR